MRGLGLLGIALLVGCSGPFMGLPGGSLGSDTASTGWSKRSQDGVLELETNPSDPYSVIIGFRAINGQIYIDPAVDRKWYGFLASDPQVRVRFDGEDLIYAARALPVEDGEILSLFEADRHVHRLVPGH